MESVLGLIALVWLVYAIRKAWRDATAPPPSAGSHTPRSQTPASRPAERAGPSASVREEQRRQREDDAFVDGAIIGGWLWHRHLENQASEDRFLHDDPSDGDGDGWDDGFHDDFADDGWDGW